MSSVSSDLERSDGLLLLVGEGLGVEGAVALAHEDLDFAFGVFELVLAVGGKLHAFFEEFDRFFEGEVAAFEAAYDGFELFEGFFESGHCGSPEL